VDEISGKIALPTAVSGFAFALAGFRPINATAKNSKFAYLGVVAEVGTIARE